MPDLCYTAAQVKVIRALIFSMMGLSLYQSFVIRRVVKAYNRGSQNFTALRNGTMYLLNVIEENNIELTEFDLIALMNIIEESSDD